MKLMVIILRDFDVDNAIQELVSQGFRVTRMASTGGFLKRGNGTLMVGLEENQVEKVFTLLRKTCRPADAEQHRATVFVVDMPYFEKI